MMAKYPDQTRNLNAPHKAHVARIIWGREYAAQDGGVMDFWDTLSDERKKRCELVVEHLQATEAKQS